MEKAELDKLKEEILEQADKLPEEQANALREKIGEMNDEEFEKFFKEFALPLQDCLFCQIAQGKIPTIKIYESKNILAILDINPATPGHIIVMPKQHYQFLTQLPDAPLLEIFNFVRHIIPAIIRTVKSQGVAINILQGKEQNVPHFSVNIIPRFEKDKLDFTWKRLKLPKEELEKIAASIRAEASNMAKEKTSQAESKKQVKEQQEEIGGLGESEGGETEESEKEEPEENKEQETSTQEFSKEELAKFFGRRIPH